MDTTAQTPPKDLKKPAEKPGWALVGLLATGFFAAVRLGGTGGWWTALWVPLLILALFALSYEWTVLVRNRFRMGFWKWPTMVSSHIAVLFGLAITAGLVNL